MDTKQLLLTLQAILSGIGLGVIILGIGYFTMQCGYNFEKFKRMEKDVEELRKADLNFRIGRLERRIEGGDGE